MRKFRKIIYLFYAVLLVNSCHCGKPKYKGNEIILFLGEPGAGKSSLCNAIFQQPVFKSGVNKKIPLLTGNTGASTCKQEYIYNNKLYIDTPGIGSFTLLDRKKIATEIEQALSYNNNYKIVFVIDYNSIIFRAQPEYKEITDMIDKVCNAIQTNFEYGIVFNKVPKYIIQLLDKAGIDQEKIHQSPYVGIKLRKEPSLTVVLEEDKDLQFATNKYLQADNENRKKLLNFLNKLNAHKITPDKVSKIDTSKP